MSSINFNVAMLSETPVSATATLIKETSGLRTLVVAQLDKVTGTINWLTDEGAESSSITLNDVLLEQYSTEELILRAYLG